MAILKAGESWIAPHLGWKREPSVFACRVPANDTGLVQLLADDCITSNVLPKKHAKLLANIGHGIHAACMVLASVLGKNSKEGDHVTLFLHDLLRLPDGAFLALLGPGPSLNASSAAHLSRRRLAAERVLDYEQKVAEKKKLSEELRTSIRNRTNLSEEEKSKHLHAIEVGEVFLGDHLQPPRLSDLGIDLEQVAFVCPLPRTTRARENAVIATVRSSARGFSRSGGYECTEIKTEEQKVAAIISWTPRGLATPALEVRAALERRFKSALSNPRLVSQHPPDLAPPDNSEAISRVEVSDKVEGLDQGSLSDMLPQPTSEGTEIFKAQGFEAIAWYQSFHRYEETVWGIYLNARNLDLVAASLAQDLRKAGPRSRELAARLVVQLTVAHELFHARVDFATAWFELGSRRRCYLPYSATVYSAHRFTENWREESLANWSADRWLAMNLPLLQAEGLVQDSDALVTVIHSWLDFSPVGYRDWRDGNKHETWARLASELVTGKPYPSAGREVPLPIEGLLRGNDFIDLQREDVPVYCVGRGVIADALFCAPSRREVLRVLKHFGYQLLPGRGKGSHEVWQGPNNRIFTVPQRDPLSVGVFHELLEHFGWTKQQYMREIRALT